MFFSFLNPEIQKFINANLETEISKLALQKNPFPSTNWIEIVNQIAAKKKTKNKLPTWFQTDGIVYPNKISVEQTSSEKTALYKSSLIYGTCLIDLTGGFGVDDYYFSKQLEKVVHCEINEELSAIVQHNFKQLGVQNIECITGDSTEQLKVLNITWDLIYIDPSRRSHHKEKVFMLEDCSPNVPKLLNFYFDYTSNILIKTAPILDITSATKELRNIKCIHIIAVENEVKELLWELSKEYIGAISIKTINFIKNKSETFDIILKAKNKATYSMPRKYLYEPNNAIMKSGAFDAVSSYYKLDKLHVNSHLYTSDNNSDFAGRVFKINEVIPYQKKEMKTFLYDKKVNITIRNFPDSVKNIRKKWKIRDGGQVYCFFTTDMKNNKIVLICTKIK